MEKTIIIKVTAEEQKLIRILAAKKNLSMREWVRDQVMKIVEKSKEKIDGLD